MTTPLPYLVNTPANWSAPLHPSPCGPGAYRDFYQTARDITGLLVYPLLCVVGVVGNSLSFCVFWHPDMRGYSTNVYLSSMAVSDLLKLLNDLLYSAIVLIGKADDQLMQKLMSEVYPATHYVFNVAVLVTSWLTVSVAVERFIYVCRPTRANQWCKVPRARLVCSAVFFIMIILAIPSSLRYEAKTIPGDFSNETCFAIVLTEFGKNKDFMDPWSWTQNLARGVIPVFILSYLNLRIILELRRERVHGRRFEARNKIARMLIVLVFMFLVCVTPDAIMSTVFGKGYGDEDYLTKGVREITDTLLAVNSAFNFFFYLSMSEKFRETFTRMYCRRDTCCCRVKVTGCPLSLTSQRELVRLVTTGKGVVSSTDKVTYHSSTTQETRNNVNSHIFSHGGDRKEDYL